ncbi:MAG: hypothetical protein ABI640_18695 [Gammaproteobacteria bacterium]
MMHKRWDQFAGLGGDAWEPQLQKPAERAVVPPPRGEFRVAPR